MEVHKGKRGKDEQLSPNLVLLCKYVCKYYEHNYVFGICILCFMNMRHKKLCKYSIYVHVITNTDTHHFWYPCTAHPHNRLLLPRPTSSHLILRNGQQCHKQRMLKW